MPDSHFYTRIKKLSPLLINQLAAGEVVTRPAAVVKELLENAIDAGATNIDVSITQGGMGTIEVVDNGTGIHPDDMVMAITRHATSKVADVANLHGITTLGFRGEALAAMAAVSRLSLTSSHDDSGIGRQLQVAGVLDDTPKLTPVVHNRGTTIVVKDLYFNVPARRGNLKSIATEFGHIETIVREVALARADVALTLCHDNKKRLSLSASNHSSSDNKRLPLSRLEQATGMALTDDAINISIDLSSLIQQPIAYDNMVTSQASISGWLWPMHHEQTALPKLIYVNGRLVKEALISNQIRQLAQSAQLAGVGYALYFELPTQWLNINVHPSKQRIKISPLNNIMAHLNHTIRTKLKTIETVKTTSTPMVDAAQEVCSELPDGNALMGDSLTGRSSEMSTSSTQPTDTHRRRPQVQSVRQSYQADPTRSNPIETSSQKSTHSHISDSTDQNNSDAPHYSAEMKPRASSLPVCLDIVTGLGNVVTATSINSNMDDSTLPWLLFYNQGQCLLVSVKDWQSKVNQLFESQLFDSKAFNQNQMPNSASDINQQLNEINSQMSVQDSIMFETDLTEILKNSALKVIDSSRLVALMLSSKS